jgi:short-subunit dehydrogenase
LTALITGASKGIGREFVIEFARHKIDVVIVARSKKLLNELAFFVKREYNVSTHVVCIDLSNINAAEELYEILKKKNLTVNYLVNNAGFGDYGEFAKSNLKKQSEMINLNILTLTKLTHLFVQDMKDRKYGKILNLASVAAFQPGPLMSVYFATKQYVLGFSEAISEELKRYNVQVTALCPGPTESDFGQVADFQMLKNPKPNRFPSAKAVAQYGYKMMLKGRVVAIHGIMNTIMTTLVRIVPRSLVRKIVRYRLK